MRRGSCRWEGIPYADHHVILRPEVVACIMCKSGICEFGQKYVSSGESVLEAGRSRDARKVSLGRQNIRGTPFNIKAISCRNYPVQKWNL